MMWRGRKAAMAIMIKKTMDGNNDDPEILSVLISIVLTAFIMNLILLIVMIPMVTIAVIP